MRTSLVPIYICGMLLTCCTKVKIKPQPIQLENNLVSTETEMKQILNESSQHFMEKNEMIAFNSDVKQNLVLCHNFKFTIRIDELYNGELRYACWAKPKTIMEKPDLILLDGYVQENANQDRFEYFFSNGEYTYIIEKIISGEHDRTVHIFLEILDKHNENSAWKMTVLSAIKIQR